MINLIIDGIPVEAAEDATILEAAAAAGVEIPTLCYLKDVSSIGSCRMCVVEIEGTDRGPAGEQAAGDAVHEPEGICGLCVLPLLR